MNRFAPEERAVFIKEAAARLGVHPVIVEKDFWVTWTLARLFEEPSYRPALVFKGGTSLSRYRPVDQPRAAGAQRSLSGRRSKFLETAKRMREIEHLWWIAGKSLLPDIPDQAELNTRSTAWRFLLWGRL